MSPSCNARPSPLIAASLQEIRGSIEKVPRCSPRSISNRRRCYATPKISNFFLDFPLEDSEEEDEIDHLKSRVPMPSDDARIVCRPDVEASDTTDVEAKQDTGYSVVHSPASDNNGDSYDGEEVAPVLSSSYDDFSATTFDDSEPEVDLEAAETALEELLDEGRAHEAMMLRMALEKKHDYCVSMLIFTMRGCLKRPSIVRN